MLGFKDFSERQINISVKAKGNSLAFISTRSLKTLKVTIILAF